MTGNFTCPVDGTKLVAMDRQGIEIDHCPTCRGIWLDRGELDKIMERSAAQMAPAPAPAAPPPQQYDRQPSYDRQPQYDDRHPHYGDHYKHKRKKSFFEELFD
ncbi:zf-TFIIB domain-containing protein [Sphingomonas sp. AOB5]|uniref:TFIIB-type zinc ribbon-containing protein n=1 Tax=Sphingomonas sp. AOB5 TaxID=3034017 RepID=UPI0023F6F002|nr:zf-TFIIB domain-containing protein [Sphingomonas sp. AOB5]MDF7774548.1 zf-TFIIB domain-containing protein [Sphingomonas sp. AOB5]